MRSKVNVEKESLDWSALDARVEALKTTIDRVKKENDDLEADYNKLVLFIQEVKAVRHDS